MNKIIVPSVIAVIAVVGGFGIYFASTLTVSSPQTPEQTVSVTPTTGSPSKFPYQFSKEIFEKNVFPQTTYTSNEPIKIESQQEILDFLKQSQRVQQQFAMYDRNSNALMEPVPFGSGSPLKEPRPAIPPSLREGAQEESLTLSQRAIEAAPTHGGAIEWSSGEAIPYSTTNVQVQNVDEPDYLKTDGKFIYIGTQNTITIIEAYPPENADVVTRFALDIEPQNIENMFLNGNNLVIIYHGTSESQAIAEFDYRPYPVYNSKTIISVIDVTDKQHAKVTSKHEVDGYYTNARMIGNIVYVISTTNVDYTNPIIPRIMTESQIVTPDVYRFPNPEEGYNFNTITAVDVSGELMNSESFLMGYTNSIYVSEENLYITYQKNPAPIEYDSIQKERFFDVIVPLLPKEVQDSIKSIQNDSTLDGREKWRKVSEALQDAYNHMTKEQKDDLFAKMSKAIDEYDTNLQYNTSRTAIHKISLDDGKLTYIANNEVPGHPLNQFSMDEHSGMFRIATTSEMYQPGRTILSNNVYVLDKNMQLAGKLEKIAPEERIYSARFMGDKLYLVTFKQVDPFFVIDLSSSTPKILGELKIPGFSNYLQPYDETHIIGIGRDTKENNWGGFEQKGVKISMFDVSDFNKPKETDTILIGDSGTYSDAIDNHKALLLDKDKGIISIPIKTNFASLLPQNKITSSDYNKNWYGFYVYNLDQSGFTEKGTVLHYQWQNGYNNQFMQPRSFYIGDYLYTVMDGSLKINTIDDLDEVNSIKIQQTGNIIPFVK